MKLSLFSITIALASFVAANPILAPRAASRPFKLGTPDRRSQDPYLQAEYVSGGGKRRGYYRLGWFGPTWRDPEKTLFFPDGPPPQARVFDIKQNGYEMVLERLFDAPEDKEPAYTALLVHQSDIAGRNIKTNILFDLYGDKFVCWDAALKTTGRWWACPYFEPGGRDLYHTLQYSQSKPTLCPLVREVTLNAAYQSADPVQVTAVVSA